MSLAGIVSSQSRSAQTGALSLVTSDGLGNLATLALNVGTFRGLDVRATSLKGRANALENRAAALEGRTVALTRRADQADGGIAAAMALGGTVLPPNSTMAVSFNLATYRCEQGFSGSAVAKVTERIYLSGGIGGSTVKGSTGGRVGVTLGW